MVLTKSEILKEIKKGRINIDPLNSENIGPVSVDLTLDNKFRVFCRPRRICNVDENADYRKITRPVKADSILIKPHETILGITKEKITLADNICGRLEGRTRFARLGLMVHISASLVNPGVSNHQVLEINNMSCVPLKLHSGTKICQILFERTKGKARYLGQFVNQAEP